MKMKMKWEDKNPRDVRIEMTRTPRKVGGKGRGVTREEAEMLKRQN